MELREIRSIEDNLIIESRKVSGYALVFNKMSEILGKEIRFREVIAPGALDGVVENSDVEALYNHKRDMGILAVSIHGEGGLKLDVDEIGLRYEFEAPNTPLGDKLIENIKSGEMRNSSFCFTVTADAQEWRNAGDGTYIRTINKIDGLFDVSPVFNPAYPDTTVAMRSLEEYRSLEHENLSHDNVEQTENEQVEELNETTEQVENVEQVDNEHENLSHENNEDNQSAENEQDNEKEKSTKVDDENHNEVEDRNVDNNKKIYKKMEKFSLVKAIRSIVDNRPMSEANQAVLEKGRKECRNAGISFGGNIQLPMEWREEEGAEAPATVVIPQAGVEGYGAEVIETDKFSLMAPLTNKLVFTELGATYLNITNNISVPKMSALNAGWAGEVEAAAQTTATFSTKEFSPKRITAYIDISKTLLYQDGTGVEQMVRNQLVDAIAQVLEGTILGDEASTDKKPAGIFNGAGTKDLTFDGVVAMETTLENANVSGNYKYLVNPTDKSALRKTTVSGSKSDLRMLLDGSNGDINGIPVVCTKNAAGIALADWSNLWITVFGGVDIVVDTVSQAINNCVRIVVSLNVDGKFVRDEAVVAKK